MRVVLQRVTGATVRVDGAAIGEIGRGLLVLIGFTHDDTAADGAWMAGKLLGLRVFPDADGKLNRSVVEITGELLVVSQFTLYGDARNGRRPSFVAALPAAAAVPLYQEFIAALQRGGIRVATGAFGADMQVELVNDGPVTIVIDSPAHTQLVQETQ